MKFRFFVPLLLYVLLTYIPLITMIPPDYIMIIQFSSFILSFSLTYFFGVRENIRNRDAVLKMKQITPTLVPLLFFAIPTVTVRYILIPKDGETAVQFAVCFVAAVLVYFSGIFLVIRHLRKSAIARITPAGRATGKKRLVLINPVNKKKGGLTNSVSSRFPPLGLGIIAALTPSDEFEIKIIDENFDDFQFEPADLVGITAFTSAAVRAYEIAALYREKSVPVVMGGIHVSMVPDEALAYADSVVIGEAESVWPGLLEDFRNGCLKPLYRAELQDLAGTVVPRRDLFHKDYMFAAVQTSRGCPMDCSFCSVTAFNGRKYRQRPVLEILDELEAIGTQYLFFIDDNIIGYSREHKRRAVELFKGMVERKMEKRWFCQASLNFGEDDEVLEWAHRAGCRMVFLGLESPDHEDLKEFDKKLNLRLNYEKLLKNISRHKIAVLGAFIAGTDNETEKSLEHKAKYILGSSIDVIQSTILTPLPGTRLYNRLRLDGRLVHQNYPEDWERYDMGDLVFSLNNLDGEKFIKLNFQNIKKYYSRPNLVRMFLRTLIRSKSIECALWAYNSNCNYRAVTFSK